MRWHECTLQEIGELARGRSRHRPRYAFHLYGGPYPFIQTGDIREAKKYINCYTQTYSEEGLKQSKIWPKGTLCITIAANIAEIGILDFDACFPDSVLGFIPNQDKADLNFIYYTLMHYKRELQYLGEGSVQDNINLGTFENMKFPIPSLPEQRAIAAVLSSLDDKIDLLHRQNATLEAMGEALFKQWFVAEAKGEWAKCQLGDILLVLESGSRPKGGIDSNLTIGIPSIGAENINGIGKYDFTKTKLIPFEFYQNMKRGKIINNDVLIYKDGAYIGKKALFGKNFPYKECAVNEHVFILRANKKATQIFLYFLLQQDEIEMLNSNAAQPGINQEALKSLEIVLPSINIIRQFDEVVSPYIDKILENSIQIRTLEKLRDTLLPKLMSGEVRVAIS